MAVHMLSKSLACQHFYWVFGWKLKKKPTKKKPLQKLELHVSGKISGQKKERPDNRPNFEKKR